MNFITVVIVIVIVLCFSKYRAIGWILSSDKLLIVIIYLLRIACVLMIVAK